MVCGAPSGSEVALHGSPAPFLEANSFRHRLVLGAVPAAAQVVPALARWPTLGLGQDPASGTCASARKNLPQHNQANSPNHHGQRSSKGPVHCGSEPEAIPGSSRVAANHAALRPPQPVEEHGQRMQLIHVVGRRVARVSDQQKFPGANLTELLQSRGTPLQHRPPGQP